MPLKPPAWIESREYQQDAVQGWFGNRGRGILRMATGTGKTITALLAASQVSKQADNGFVLIIAVPYQHLVDQWAEEAAAFDADPVLAYESRQNWQPRLERELLEFNNSVRDTCVIITTHRTLSGAPARQTIRRSASQSMLIADEVHHLGANQLQEGLMESVPLRLGLSATPERWYDEEGTEALESYFGGTVFEYDLKQAISNGALCEYYYVPHIVELQGPEMDEYLRLTQKIGRLMQSTDDDELGGNENEENSALERALFKRARLVGTAKQKLDLLVELFKQEDDPAYSLVYCAGGSIGVDSEGNRHIDETTRRLRKECGLTVKRFTAREDQAEREQLLEQFANGELQVLTSIRCLDEGVDVPATKTAYILASTSNPRQYVQRRGRILRQHKRKDFAVIHDFITVPDTAHSPEVLTDQRYSAERSLIRKELERVTTFAEAARNHPDADIDDVPTTDESLQALKRKYDLLTV